jgi:ubiquinone/menaquinone biosynthesis C-methylase UbiE
LVEFTGERVIPDQVEPDLWSEHLARYAFAQRYAAGKHVLDCGCGTGYGTFELAQVATEVTGLDLSCDAIEYARANYARANTRYVTASCLDLPFPDGSFELIAAFEVIEHLADFRRFLDECARVLAPSGLFIVSTPNKHYYEESRAQSGPNPFHEHEFEAAEFHSELNRVYPSVTLLAQNHVECFSFAARPHSTAEARVDGEGSQPADANFIIALCSKTALPPAQSFIYVPQTANLLHEREQHIRLLDAELHTTQAWLRQTQHDRDRLLDQHRELLESYETQNRWAKSLEVDLTAARERIDQLQSEFASEQQSAVETARSYEAKVVELDAENLAKTKWALETDARLTAEIERITQELVRLNQLLQTAEETVVERTTMAQRLENQKQALEAQLNSVRASRWMKLGRKLGVGPVLD